MLPVRRVSSLVGLSALVLGCATSQAFDRTTEPGGKPLPASTASRLVLTGDQLSANGGWTILDAIKRAMPQMQVSDWTQPNNCPVLALRGQDTVTGDNNPDIYVDGTHSVDTCPLVTLQAAEARSVEIYPQGVTPRPGYPSRGHGLILIFLQRAGETGS
jgi:TonB-dependent Receptor Plug Domain